MKKIEMLIAKLNEKIAEYEMKYNVYDKMAQDTDNEFFVEKLADYMTEIEIDLIPQLEIEIETLQETLEIVKKYLK